MELPNKKYEIIYADPPWDYGSGNMHNGIVRTSASDDHYPTMHWKEIATLPIQTITSKNCLLFMWTPSPHLKHGVEIGEVWGFEYKTIAFVWNKGKSNPGAYTMSSCELCLVFKKGNIPRNREARNVKQYVGRCRTRHSAKPHEVRARIEKMFPMQRKIELFARVAYPG